MSTRKGNMLSDRNVGSSLAQSVLERSSRIRVAELLDGSHPRLLYRVENRNGVSVVAIRTESMNGKQIESILTYRLAQYLTAGYVDPATISKFGIRHEPQYNVCADDVHIIAGSPTSGEIFCYSVIRACDATSGATLRTQLKPSLPVVDLCGSGVFSRLKILPDLPLNRIREIGRLSKNLQLADANDSLARAPVEVCIALITLLTGRLRSEIDACVGDLEEGVVKKYFEYFHVPYVVQRGVIPEVAEGSLLQRRFETADVYPFAFLVSDMVLARERLKLIENWMDTPGLDGLRHLVAGRRTGIATKSSLQPSGPIPQLNTFPVPQAGVPMQARRRMNAFGEWLRCIEPFKALSRAEAAILGTFFERQHVSSGAIIIREGQQDQGLFLIESGLASVRMQAPSRTDVAAITLGPRSLFGEFSMLTGEPAEADVVAMEETVLLHLPHVACTRFLADLIEVQCILSRRALNRITEIRRAACLH